MNKPCLKTIIGSPSTDKPEEIPAWERGLESNQVMFFLFTGEGNGIALAKKNVRYLDMRRIENSAI